MSVEIPHDPPRPAVQPDAVLKAIEDTIERLTAEGRAKEAAQREESAQKERLTARVSIAAILLTMLMSFLNFARSERDQATTDAKTAAAHARGEADVSWAHYQTASAERSSYQLASDQLLQEATTLGGNDPRHHIAEVRHAEYATRIRDIDRENRELYFLVQDREREQILALRHAARTGRTVGRYDVGMRVLTLAVVLLSVTILANREYLFWIGSMIALAGAIVAVSGYFL